MIKCFALILLFCVLFTPTFCQKIQPQEYVDDLKFIYENLKKSASYQTQKDRHILVEEKYNLLLKEAENDLYLIEALSNYYSLIDIIKDYHNRIYSFGNPFTKEDLTDSLRVKSLLHESKYNTPQTVLNLDSLENSLKKRSALDLEGIYFNSLVRVALVQAGPKHIGVILESKIASWKRGDEIFYLFSNDANQKRIIMGEWYSKRLIGVVDYFKEGNFLGYSLLKEHAVKQNFSQKQEKGNYVFKEISPEVDYISISTFSGWNPIYQEAITFYNGIDLKGLAKNLILDLRNHVGGGDRNSLVLLKKLRKYKGNIYVLVNHQTLSNAEQFVVRLKKFPKVRVLGDRTYGVLTYGINYDRPLTTPSGRFKIAFTDLKDSWKEFLPYEGVGIEPDIYLRNDSDWIRQVLDRIK